MKPHYYDILHAGTKMIACVHNSMAEVLAYPSGDAPEDSEKKVVFTGTERAYSAWLCRLIGANITSDFTYLPRHATGPTTPPDASAILPPDPPNHKAADINTDTGELGEVLDLDTVTNGIYTVVIRTNGFPSKSTRETLKGNRLYWNPSDGRGKPDYPQNSWLRHRVPADELKSYRKLATDLRCEFDYLDRNPVEQ